MYLEETPELEASRVTRACDTVIAFSCGIDGPREEDVVAVFDVVFVAFLFLSQFPSSLLISHDQLLIILLFYLSEGIVRLA